MEKTCGVGDDCFFERHGLNLDMAYKKIQDDDEKLQNLMTNPKIKYKKNFSSFYDEIIIKEFRSRFPEKVIEYEKTAIKLEPWLRYQAKNLNQRVDRMIFPPILEKREGVSRKGVGAHLVHLSYSENSCSYSENSGRRFKDSPTADINYGDLMTISDISPERRQSILLEDGESIVCDPSLIYNPYGENCLDRLVPLNEKIKTNRMANKIISMSDSGKNFDEISSFFEKNKLSANDIKKFISQVNDRKIVCMFFGLCGYSQMTQDEISSVFNITQPAIAKRINKIISKLSKIYKDIAMETVSVGNDCEFH